MAILITTCACNLKYYVHTNIGTVSACRMYMFGNICLWSTFMETLVCRIQCPRTTQENVLVVNTYELLYPLFAEVAGLGINNF
jgi:hypothetical protein